MSVLVWFKSDLRLDDNPALLAAQESSACLPVYCLDPDQFRTDQQGMKSCGQRRAAYLLDSLADLHMSLQKLGSGLLVKIGRSYVMTSTRQMSRLWCSVWLQRCLITFD